MLWKYKSLVIFYHTKTKRKTDNWPSTTQESHNVSYFLLCKTKMGLAAAHRGLSLGLLLSFNILPTGTVSKDLFLHNLNIHPAPRKLLLNAVQFKVMFCDLDSFKTFTTTFLCNILATYLIDFVICTSRINSVWGKIRWEYKKSTVVYIWQFYAGKSAGEKFLGKSAIFPAGSLCNSL